MFLVIVQVLIAILTAFGHGATAVQFAPDAVPGAIVVEYTAPSCPTFADEPCYVIVSPDLTVEVGP